MSGCKCSYCNQDAKLVDGSVIYPHRPDLFAMKFWQCKPCGAYVGCHKKGAPIGRGVKNDGTVPLGRLANAELRQLKSQAHQAFDSIWKSGGMTRSAAYSWLAFKMGIPKSECHIGMFDEWQCRRAASLAMHWRIHNDAMRV